MARKASICRCPSGWVKRTVSLCILVVLALIIVDTATDDEEMELEIKPAPRSTLAENIASGGSSGGESPEDLWIIDKHEQTSRGCRRDGDADGCDPPDAVVIAEGDLASRLYSVCAASAVTALSNLSTAAVWASDQHMPRVTFHDLFSVPNASTPTAQSSSSTSSSSSSAGGRIWVRNSPLPAAAWRRSLHLSLRQISLPTCTNSVDRSVSLPIRVDLFLSPNAINWLQLDTPDACLFESSLASCLASLAPSPTVAAMVDGEDVGRVQASYGVFVDSLSDSSSCSGCPPRNDSSPPLCVMRRLTMSFLKDPSVDFTVAAQHAHQAAAATDYFHATRAPLLLRATQLRAATCPFGEYVPHGVGEEEGQQQQQQQQQQRSGEVVVVTADGVEGVVLPFRERISHQQLLACLQARASELFTLSSARGLIAVNASSVEATFVQAQGRGRSEMFRTQRAVCQAAEIRPITRQKFSMFTIVEEDLKLVYCAVPKVACNSWLMWLRAQMNLPHPEDPLLALDEKQGGLHELAIHFTEERAVNLITRRDLFKFTFVRNPFSRIASAYSNKVVVSDTPGKSTGPGSREYWNNAFFRFVRPVHDAVKDSSGLVAFHMFVRLVARVMETYRWQMDRHIAPQSDICSLASIKYDFVGRFENMEEDVKTVVDRFGGKHLDIFSFGRNAHFTDTDKRLAKLYDKDTYEAVKSVYSMDFHIPLNNITQQVPPVLHNLFESEL